MTGISMKKKLLRLSGNITGALPQKLNTGIRLSKFTGRFTGRKGEAEGIRPPASVALYQFV